MDPATVKSAAKSYKSLKAFVESGELARTLDAIGDVALKAALASLHSAKFADHPQREFTSTITHLQAAHAAFETKWEGGTYSSYGDYLDAATKDQQVLLLLALAYQYAGDRALALRTLHELETFENRYLKRAALTVLRHPIHTAKRSASAYVSPFKSTRALVRSIRQPLSDQQLKELRAQMETMELPAAGA